MSFSRIGLSLARHEGSETTRVVVPSSYSIERCTRARGDPKPVQR
jgi:hypothetical protein